VKNKAQEEIVGFAIIVILVAVVLVVILGIMIRQDKNSISLESRDLHQFLESSMQYTTNCSISFEPNFLTLSELLRECNDGISLCLSNEEPCKLAESTFKEIIEGSFHISPTATNKGYELLSLYTTGSTSEKITNISSGDCNQSIRGAEYKAPAFPGTITSSFKLCF
jgi:hypothetical protein